jgi:hypothetical protein
MKRDPEPAALSEGERRVLATIEAEFDAGDPGFADRYRRRLETGGARHTLFPVAAIVAGGVLMVVTFTTSLVLATMGAALMGIGAAAGAPRAEIAARRATGFLRWWVDPKDGSRRPVRDDRR